MAEQKQKWSRLSMLTMPDAVGNKATSYATYNDEKGREVIARETKGVDVDKALEATRKINMERPKDALACGGKVRRHAEGGMVRSRDDAEKLLGKRTPLPGAGKPAGANWAPKPFAAASSAKSGIAALPADPLRNPKAIIADREKKAGLACGGKVKKYAKGGVIKGAGAATRGKKFNVW